MRLIGVLGGMSWPSTVLPYRLLNAEVQRRLGGHHSARIALYSIDYHAIRSCYTRDWTMIPGLLRAEIDTLLRFGPDCWMIANNTLHKIYDGIAGDLPEAPPMMHAVHLVRDHLLAAGIARVLLLGTRFTMEDGYFADPLRAAGIEVTVPGEADRARIGDIQMVLAEGEVRPEFAGYFAGVIARHAAAGCGAVITGCTELPLAITQALSPIPVVDPLVLQTRACVDFALATTPAPAGSR